MDEANKGESKGDVLKVHDDKKGKWNSLRKGKKHISKLWKSRKRSKTVEDDSEEEDDDDVYDDRPQMSPDSAASSSIGRVPSITLRRPSISTPSSPDSTFLDAGATTDEDERYYSSGREAPNNEQWLITNPSEVSYYVVNNSEYGLCSLQVFEDQQQTCHCPNCGWYTWSSFLVII